MTTFFCDNDYERYLELLHKNMLKAEVKIWAYCLMPNHVHLVAIPRHLDSLAKMLRVTHHCFARTINSRNGWQGHLWQERFHSFVMDEPHLIAAVRYIELNPVRAGLCRLADQWRWSSVHAHLHGRSDPILGEVPMRDLISNWSEYLNKPLPGPTNDEIRKHTCNGRPAGDDSFLGKLESLTGHRLRKLKPGPKKRE